MEDKAWEKLESYFAKIDELSHIAGIVYYDIETSCPIKAVEEQSEIAGKLFTQIAAISQDKEFVALLKEEAAKEGLHPMRKRKVEGCLQQVELMEKMSLEEFTNYRKLKSESNFAWKKAKPTGDFAAWLPYWKKMIAEERRVLGLQKKPKHKTLYDVALDKYEDDSSEEQIDAIFNPLKEFLIKKIPEALKKQAQHKLPELKPYDVDRQRHLGLAILKMIDYDMDSGCLRESVHPFSDPLGRHDARVTTRYYVEDWRANAATCLHEGGHCIQFQNWSDEQWENRANMLATSALCETHSRFYENIIGRSFAFAPHLKKACAEHLDPAFGEMGLEDFYHLMNEVKPIPNRCNSDELTYCLHIIIRYEIERDLINGVIECDDVPAIWNAKYKEYLGVDVPDDGEGCMQDVHWTDGEIGYFPSYALGNMYGAQIKETMAKQLDFDKLIADGDLGKIRLWFAENDFCYDYMKPNDWIVKVTGEPLNPRYYIDYLDKKF